MHATLELERGVRAKHSLDVVGHYARLDVFELRVNRGAQPPFLGLEDISSASLPREAIEEQRKELEIWR